MRLGGQVNHAIWLVAGEYRAQGVSIADVDLLEVISRVCRDRRDGLSARGLASAYLRSWIDMPPTSALTIRPVSVPFNCSTTPFSLLSVIDCCPWLPIVAPPVAEL